MKIKMEAKEIESGQDFMKKFNNNEEEIGCFPWVGLVIIVSESIVELLESWPRAKVVKYREHML